MVKVIDLRKSKKIKREDLPLPIRILASPVTTGVLATTLATLFNPVAAVGFLKGAAKGVGKFFQPKTTTQAVSRFVGIPTALGVLAISPTARGFLDPRESFGRGKSLGEIIEDPSKLEDVLKIKEKDTLKEKIIGGAKTAGVAGGVIAAGAGIVAVGKKVKEKFTETKIPTPTIPDIPSFVPPTFTQLPVGTALQQEPIGIVEKEIPEVIAEPVKTEMPSITNKNVFSPEINIKFSKSRKFINQQIVV